MSGIGQYELRYMQGTFMHVCPCWGLLLFSHRSWRGISCFLRMYMSFPCKSAFLIWFIQFFSSSEHMCSGTRIETCSQPYYLSFVSSPVTYHTETSDKCISQTFLAASFIIDFTTSVPTECTCSYFTSGVPWPLKTSVHSHRCDQYDPGYYRVLQQFDQFPTLHTISSPFHVPTGWVSRSAHMYITRADRCSP
jgi:hypothetical protein